MNEKRPNIIRDKSFAFVLRIVKKYKFLVEKKEFVLSKQLLRSGTAIGALNKILALIIISSKEKYAKK